MTGFTGVVWHARTTDRLAADLASGVGPASLVDAGVAWAVVAAEVAEVAVDYVDVLDRIRNSWQSTNAHAALDQLETLGRWMSDVAEDATVNAVRAEEQSAAAAVARLSMPATAEVELVDGLHDLARSVSAVAPMISGAAAHAERARHDQRMRAARVMEAYEQAATPAARQWHVEHRAPLLVSDAALHAERAAAAGSNGTSDRAGRSTPQSAASAVVNGGVVPVVPPGIPSQIRAGYAATTLASATQAVVPAAAAHAQPLKPPEPTPPPMASMAGATSDHRAAPRASAIPREVATEERTCCASITRDLPATWADLGVAATSRVELTVDVESGSPTIDPAYLDQALRLGEVPTR